MDVISIDNGSVRAELYRPGTYYKGTRFDWGGVFASLRYRGLEYVEPWFEKYEPTMHDAVCGPSEEFSPIGYDSDSGLFLKIGVGLLRRPDDAGYDRFRLYPVADPGEWTITSGEGRVSFLHRISPGSFGYEYSKDIVLTDNGFCIGHRIVNTGASILEGDVYNHNFFTFSRLETTPSRSISFPFEPEGNWRAQYESVGIVGRDIRFFRQLAKGESVYMGDIRAAGATVSPYGIVIREGDVAVEAVSDAPLSRAVFWSNHRIACIEPYTLFRIPPGEEWNFEILYRFVQYSGDDRIE